ncbi:FHA domain-containing protein [Desulfobacterales bacterium HSG16]|nr:FHA domain-containing protein [Desulfobacterales bacterium HSG16]
MIVFCEECGARNIVDPDKLKEQSELPRCMTCDDILRIALPQSSGKPEKVPVTPGLRLKLKFKNSVVEISQVRPSVTMGRQGHNNLVVEDSRVSRSHARIVYRQKQFILIDHSTNGTYVFVKGKKGMNLKQNEIQLAGSGIFGLGRKVAPDSPEAIHFAIAKT